MSLQGALVRPEVQIPTNPWTRSAVVYEALEWVGTPYQHGQRCKGVGCDCIGVPGGVALALGFPSGREWANDPACKGYGREPDPAMLMAACERHLVRIPVEEALPGDIYVMRFEKEPHHFAIIVRLNPTYVVHAYVSARKVCETPIDGYWRQGVIWKSLIVSAWRYKELAE